MGQLTTNPWLKMWTKPRETIRSIVKTDPEKNLWYLAGVYGFPMLLHFSQTLSLAQKIPTYLIVIGSFILSALVGMIGFQITSMLVHWTGKWLNGAATFLQVRAAVAWSNVTNVATGVLWLLLISYFGSEVFMRTFGDTPFVGAALAVAGSIFLLQTVLSVWSFVLFVCSLAEVQQFSIGKAILNIILPFVIVTAALWAFFVFVGWAVGMKS